MWHEPWRSCWLPSLLSCWLLLQASTAAHKWSAAARRLNNSAPSSPLLRLHMQTLRLRPNGGRRPHYAMRAPRLRLVKPA